MAVSLKEEKVVCACIYVNYSSQSNNQYLKTYILIRVRPSTGSGSPEQAD
jgi:hypothetical protein